MNTKLLEEFGFTPKEIDVYLVLLGLKTASIFEIMSRAKVSRQSIYEILQKLLDKGLISYSIKDNKKQYQATSPDRLKNILEDEQTLLKEKALNLDKLLPELLARYNENKDETKLEFFSGKEGLKTISNITLKEKKSVYILAGEGKIFDTLKYFMPNFLEKRAELGIHTKMVYTESCRKMNLKIPLCEIKYVPDEYDMPISMAIYGEHINILIYSENPVGIHIQSKEIAQSFMNYFNLMWNIAKK